MNRKQTRKNAKVMTLWTMTLPPLLLMLLHEKFQYLQLKGRKLWVVMVVERLLWLNFYKEAQGFDLLLYENVFRFFTSDYYLKFYELL